MYRVLVVDDERYEREGVRRLLEHVSGISEVDIAENGLTALEKFEENPYDIVISDVKMPVMDGLTMAVEMQNISSDMEILFMSGYDDFMLVKQAIQIHSYDYLLKPTSGELVVKVQEMIEALDKKYESQRLHQRLLEDYGQHQKVLGIEFLDYFTNGHWNQVRRILRNLRYLEFPYLIWIYGCKGEYEKEKELEVISRLKKGTPLFPDCFIGLWKGELLIVLSSAYKAERSAIKNFLRNVETGMDSSEEKWEFCFLCTKVGEDMLERVSAWKENDVQELLKKNRKSSCYSAIVSKMISKVQTCYMEELSIKKIANEFGYSPNYLSAVFKKECGKGFYDYLIQVRMEKSKQFLLKDNMKIYEVASAVGYEDAVAFTKRFKRVYGETPAQFRDRQGIKEGDL